MNLGEMVAEVQARGYDYLSTRLYTFVNQAANELDGMQRWPYLLKSVTGAVPLQVDDLGAIQSVVDVNTNTPLDVSALDEVLDVYGDLTTSGTPAVWYLTWLTGAASVNTYPVTTGSVKVRYWQVSPGLAVDSDEPLSPSRFHMLICDIATRYAALDAKDYQGAQVMQQDIDRKLALMVGDLMRDQGATYVTAVGDDL